jgi:acetoin utilization protein AcuB
MQVLDIMTRDVVTLSRTDSLATAIDTMEKFDTRHLVVVEPDGKLIGIISDRDCKLGMKSPFVEYDEAQARKMAEKILVERIMTPMPEWIDPRCSVEEAATLMLEKHISCLPVMHDKLVIGIITTTDLLRVLVKQEVV